MKNLLTIVAAVALAAVVVDSIARFFIRNTKKYLRNDSFQI